MTCTWPNRMSVHGYCVPVTCPTGTVRQADETCLDEECARWGICADCPPGQVHDHYGYCIPAVTCPPGTAWDDGVGQCECTTPGKTWNELKKACVDICVAPGSHWNSSERVCQCFNPIGSRLSADGRSCQCAPGLVNVAGACMAGEMDPRTLFTGICNPGTTPKIYKPDGISLDWKVPKLNWKVISNSGLGLLLPAPPDRSLFVSCMRVPEDCQQVELEKQIQFPNGKVQALPVNAIVIPPSAADFLKVLALKNSPLPQASSTFLKALNGWEDGVIAEVYDLRAGTNPNYSSYCIGGICDGEDGYWVVNRWLLYYGENTNGMGVLINIPYYKKNTSWYSGVADLLKSPFKALKGLVTEIVDLVKSILPELCSPLAQLAASAAGPEVLKAYQITCALLTDGDDVDNTSPKSEFPWVWVAAGVGVVAVGGLTVWGISRRSKQKRLSSGSRRSG